jgi:hypothetical protein
MLFRFLLSLVGLALPLGTLAQTPTDTTSRTDSLRIGPDVEAVADDLGPQRGDPAQLAERLTELAAHPLDVNTASATDLTQIPSVSPLIARRIVQFRRTHGPFASLHALQRVEGMTQRRFLQARPYLQTRERDASGEASRESEAPRPSLRRIASNLQVTVMQRAERRLDLGRGYQADTTRTTFLGSPTRLTTRLRARDGRFVRAALTFDKDPGEAFAWDPARQTYGFDHVAGAVSLYDVGRLRTLVVGDYSAAFGQGLALWRGIAFGKGRQAVESLVRTGRGVVAHASTEENQFFRGVAATVEPVSNLAITAFGSRRTLDASLGAPAVDATGAGVRPAVTLQQSGLHRTPAEYARKDALHETVIGGAAEATWSDVTIGGTVHQTRFDRPLDPGDAPYERFDFAGDASTMLSLYATAPLDPYTVFGEVARSRAGALGGVGGVSVAVDRTEVLLLGRLYPRSFVSLHGYAFGERNGSAQNERGVYLGVRQRLAEDWNVAAYVDQYRFPWLRFTVPRPSRGIDARLVVEHTPRPWLKHYVQVRSETREVGTTVDDPGGRLVDTVAPETRQSVRWHGTYTHSDALTLRSRIEGTRVESGGTSSYGVLLYQGVRVTPVDALQLDARLAFFDTDNFDARVFAYEHDLLYAFSVPAFFGHGQRAYLLARYRPLPRLTVEAKYGVTRFEDVSHIGSGLNETPGQRLREVGVQVRWRLGQ